MAGAPWRGASFCASKIIDVTTRVAGRSEKRTVGRRDPSSICEPAGRVHPVEQTVPFFDRYIGSGAASTGESWAGTEVCRTERCSSEVLDAFLTTSFARVAAVRIGVAAWIFLERNPGHIDRSVDLEAFTKNRHQLNVRTPASATA